MRQVKNYSCERIYVFTNLKAIPKAHVKIIIVFKLSKLRPVVLAKKDIGSRCQFPLIVDLPDEPGTQMGVVVRWAIESKEGRFKGLLPEKFCNSKS